MARPAPLPPPSARSRLALLALPLRALPWLALPLLASCPGGLDATRLEGAELRTARDALLDALDPERQARDLGQLAGAWELPDDAPPIVSRNVHHPDHARARALLEQRLAETGWTVEVQPFACEGETGTANLIARWPGLAPETERETVVLGAHFDSIASRTDGWIAAQDPAPGADDNASGVSVLLALAHAWRDAGRAPWHDLVVALFDCEEYGLVGSQHFVDISDEPLRAMISLDPVGHNPAGILFFTWDAQSEELATRSLAHQEVVREVELQAIDASLIGGDLRSDHAPFWAAGVPALHAGSFPQPAAYHTVDDHSGVVDLDFTAQVARFAMAFAVEEAGVALSAP